MRSSLEKFGIGITVTICRCFKHKVITTITELGTRHLVWSVLGNEILFDSGWLLSVDVRNYVPILLRCLA